jgi:hypothetical protein
MTSAISSNNIELIKWLRSIGAQWDEETVDTAVAMGYIDILDYLIKNGCPNENLDFVAIENNQLDCLKWIHKNVDKCDSNCYYYAETLSFLNWLKSQNIPFTNDIVYCSVKKGEFNRFKWFYENGFKFNSNITTIAAKHKRFDILEYALKNGCPINQELLNEAYRTNNLNIIELVVEYDCL